MGTVHGVYLKYVGLSALSYVGYSSLMKDPEGNRLPVWYLLGLSGRTVLNNDNHHLTWLRSAGALVLGYSFLLNGVIAILFKMEMGMGLIGKNRKTGQIPLWSQILFFPFHLPTRLYTYIHLRSHPNVPVASEVQPGWWVGSCYGNELHKEWAGVIDLTVEFPETTINTTRAYLSIPTWDGVPATPEQLEEAANFGVAAKNQGGDVLVHCAHGRGRSTTVMCACLVKAGLFKNWEEAFEHGIKPGRPVCKLNKRMRENLTEWQSVYVNPRDKKGQ